MSVHVHSVWVGGERHAFGISNEYKDTSGQGANPSYITRLKL